MVAKSQSHSPFLRWTDYQLEQLQVRRRHQPMLRCRRFPYPNRASKLWAELEGPKCPTIQQVSAAAGGGVAKVTSFLAGMDAAGHAAGHERRVMRLLDELPPGVTVVVASQGVNPELPRKLDKQKKACEDRRCASVWSVEQGQLLEALEVRARDGCVFVAVT